MELTLSINPENTNAMAFLEFIKNLDFITIQEVKKTLTATPNKTQDSLHTETEVVEEDENGIPLRDKDFILELSRKTNKAIAEKWDSYFDLK